MEQSDNNGDAMKMMVIFMMTIMMMTGRLIDTRVIMYDISATQTTMTMQYHQFCDKTMPLPTVVTTITFVLKSYSDESNNTTQQSATQT